MNQNIKKRWVEALRSGEYKQARMKLKRNEGFCCLGVLCDLHSKETGMEWDGGSYLDRTDILPNGVIGWAGLENKDPTVNNPLGEGKLSYLNDNGSTFSEIADLIEKQL